MKSGYLELAFLALSTIALANGASNNWNYHDVDLRIAERKVIPHYVRHSFDYPEINIKKIMQDRGIPIPSQNQRPWRGSSNYNSDTYFHQQGNFVNNGVERFNGKSVALSNQISAYNPHQDVYFKKKNKYYRNFPTDNKLKLKHTFY